MLLALIPIALFCVWPGQRIVSHLARQHALGHIRATDGAIYEGEGGYALKLDRSQIQHLSTLSDVGSLDLARASLTDQDLARLRPLNDLVFLNLSENPISDIGLESIANCQKMRCLILQDTSITSHGLEHISRMTDLENLLLDGTAVDDEGLTHLRGCTNLRELMLCGTSVTAAAIEDIIALPSLTTVSVPKEWSVETVARLRAENPSLTVIQQRIVISR